MMKEFENFLDEVGKCFVDNNKGSDVRSDVIEYKDRYVVLSDLPGVAKDRVSLSFDKGVLTISIKEAEHDEASYKIKERTRNYNDKKLYFSENVDVDNISAQFENGVLKVTLLKQEKKTKTIKID